MFVKPTRKDELQGGRSIVFITNKVYMKEEHQRER